MKINFNKLGQSNEVDKVFSPRDIFSLLPNKAARFDYPRDVQTEVWKQWFEKRKQRDIILKMNTGGGKTTVGLLILKSCLNERKGPAVYVAPDTFLAKQVQEEAEGLSLDVTDNPRDINFIRGKSILITNIYKVFNGRSVFGVGDEGSKIPIGSIIIDDAHACLNTVEDQFTLELKWTTYEALLDLFYDDLLEQSEPNATAVKAADYTKDMLVPFWAWQDKVQKVSQILQKAKNKDRELDFKYPLIQNDLSLCQCVFGGGIVEVSLPCLPIHAVPSFQNASRRIFMTATLADDSVLITHFSAREEDVLESIAPSSSSDLGDRMILVPQAVASDIQDNNIKILVSNMSKQINTIVIVPSNYRKTYWADVSDLILDASNLENGIERLKSGHVGLVVLVNKYDGIDLPHDACRLLVIDGLPRVRRKIDKIEHGMLQTSDAFIGQQIQRIEQGMGRGIRSNKDYCVILLMGYSLTDHLYRQNALDHFTPATRKQIELRGLLLEIG